MNYLRVVMLVRDNYPQVIRAFTGDDAAIECLEDLAAEHVKDFSLSASEMMCGLIQGF